MNSLNSRKEAIRILLIIFSIIAICSYPPYAEASFFSLDIDLSEHEKSKDSNTQTYKVSIKNSDVCCHYSTTGPPAEISKEKEFRLTDLQQQKLMEIVSQHLLDQEVNEIRPMDHLGTSIDLSVRLQYGDKVFNSQIQGMYRDWQTRTRKSNIEALDYYRKIWAIISLVKGGKHP